MSERDVGHEVTYESGGFGSTFATCTCGWRVATNPESFAEQLGAEHQEANRGA